LAANFNLIVILLSISLQIAAAGMALRINRIAGRPLAWALMSSALVLMAGRRLYVLVELYRDGFPQHLLPNEIAGFLVSALMLWGIILIKDLFQSKADQAAKLEEARKASRALADKLTAVMAAAPVPLWIAEDPACRTIRGNAAGADLLRMPVQVNHSASAPPGEQPVHFRLVQNGHTLAADEMPMQRAALRGEDIRGEAMDLVFDDGQLRHLMGYATPLREADGRIQGAVCCMVDVTAIRQVEEALAKAQKMESIGLLAGGIAHDFNNIFQAMVANIEMAQASAPEEARCRGYLDRLRAGLDRASRLSRDILHVSGGDLRRPEPMDLTPLVAEALDRTGVAAIRQLSPGLSRVMVDPLLIGRVVEGLVTNALEASSAEGAIRVQTFMRQVRPEDLAKGHWAATVDPGPYAVFEVSDQGHGIDAAALPKIFDPFFSTRDLGRGLGLPAALGIIRSHRGGIQVESIPGVGSVFRVHLPAPESLDVPPRAPMEARHGRTRVLLADDEVELRSALAEMLEDWFGLDVVPAGDGQEALELFSRQAEAFDLVILDATMPRMGGVEAFKAMRDIRPGLPGILCSGYALPASREQAVAQGFADFLKKPFTSAELAAILDRVLGIKHV
jgi:signal transduction histidine kinase/ActR/RegA family two-component response regulator